MHIFFVFIFAKYGFYAYLVFMYICKYKENLKENFACVYFREINQNIQNSKKFEHAKMSPLRYFQKDTEEIYF